MKKILTLLILTIFLAISVSAETSFDITLTSCAEELCDATVTWNHDSLTQVWVDLEGNSALMDCQTSGELPINWIQPIRDYTFSLYSATDCTVEGKGIVLKEISGKFLASEGTIEIKDKNCGETICTATASWTADKFVQVWVDLAGDEKLMACDETGDLPMDWILPSETYTFSIYNAISCESERYNLLDEFIVEPEVSETPTDDVEPTPETPPTEEPTCEGIGTRIIEENIPKYCTKEGLIIQKENGMTCLNNYECKSNTCIDQVCYSVKKEIEETRGFLQSIIDWIKSWFGIDIKSLYKTNGKDIGIDYYTTGTDFENTAFLTKYHETGVREEVQEQLAGIKESGATFLNTFIWLVSKPGTINLAWRHNFPPTNQEIENLKLYIQDVEEADLKLNILILFQGCAEFHDGDPNTLLGYRPEDGTCESVGACCSTAEEFINDAKTSISSILNAIKEVDDSNNVEKVYINHEAIAASSDEDSYVAYEKKNERWFYMSENQGGSGIWEWFWNKAETSGVTPSTYFLLVNENLAGTAYTDPDFPELNNHISMAWPYRTLKFLKNNNLPIPKQIDFSSHPADENVERFDTLFTTIFDDYDAVIPTLLERDAPFGIVETDYKFNDCEKEYNFQNSIAQEFVRPNFKSVAIWTTPAAPGFSEHVAAAAPFDLKGYFEKDPECP